MQTGGSFLGGRAAAGVVGTDCRVSPLRPLALGLLSAVALVACTTVIVPPGEVAEPVPVALLDHGRHTSLLVGTRNHAMIRYAYGDWTWYALRQTGLAEASVAVLGPSKAALGRKRHPGPLTPEAVARQIRVPIEEAFYFDVEADAAEALVDRLDAIFQANMASRVVNRAYDLEFVPHPARYSLFHNSNTMVASWLREMAVEVEGPALLARWDCRERGAGQRCGSHVGGAANLSFALSWVEAKGTGRGSIR